MKLETRLTFDLWCIRIGIIIVSLIAAALIVTIIYSIAKDVL